MQIELEVYRERKRDYVNKDARKGYKWILKRALKIIVIY